MADAPDLDALPQAVVTRRKRLRISIIWIIPLLAAMVAIGIVGLFGLLALDRALHLAPASVVAPFAGLQAVWTLLLDHALSSTQLGARQLLGALVLACGSVYLCALEWRGAKTAWPA